jgi:hypothetical protein
MTHDLNRASDIKKDGWRQRLVQGIERANRSGNKDPPRRDPNDDDGDEIGDACGPREFRERRWG